MMEMTVGARKNEIIGRERDHMELKMQFPMAAESGKLDDKIMMIAEKKELMGVLMDTEKSDTPMMMMSGFGMSHLETSSCQSFLRCFCVVSVISWQYDRRLLWDEIN